MPSEAELVARLRNGYRVLAGLHSQDKDTEEDARLQLIDPLVFHLYEAAYVRREERDLGNRPDYVLYTREITEGGPARAIVEAKPLATDFDKAPSGDRVEMPHRQAVRYLRDHAAANPDTVGALTDGLRWRLYRREAETVEVEREVDIGPLVRRETEDQGQLDTLLRSLERPSRRGTAGSVGDRALRELAAAVKTGPLAAVEALRALGALSERDPVAAADLEGQERDQVLTDWIEHAHGDGPEIPTSEGEQTLLDPPRVRLAAVRLKHNESGLVRAEVARCARILASQSSKRVAVVFVWHAGSDGSIEARLAVAQGRRVAMTQPFDPDLPPPAARRAVTRVLELTRRSEVAYQTLVAPLDVLPLQRSFYEQVRAWIRRLRHDEGVFLGSLGEGDRHEVLLRHLIRTLFVWILKEEDKLPSALFQAAFVEEHAILNYHEGVLRFLFHERLNTEYRDRKAHSIDAVTAEFVDVPFLNGSLFEAREGDTRLTLRNSDYWSDDAKTPGLFDLLGHYHWTADEQRPEEREQTLDPELLSNLFEQMLADPLLEAQDAEKKKGTVKAPDGAYYTPMDVTAEMAADALVAAVRNYVPTSVSNKELLDLFRDPDAELPDISLTRRAQLLRRIAELRVFDPAVGSGAFLLAVLQALRTALHKLHQDDTDQTRIIITEQLHGQDINPMAAQIARLRLFIALQHAERNVTDPAPLPNLEARIVCADTLFTHPAEGYDPFAPASAETLASADPWTRTVLENALQNIAEVRQQWPNAHSEGTKRSRRSEDRVAREELRKHLDDTFLSSDALAELQALADHPLLELAHDEAASIDPRLLFAQAEGNWQGFDVVIGNPPYQSYRKSDIGDTERDALKARGYRTTSTSDIYTLFCEAALALARPNGVVTMVVPLSIAFGRQERALRAVFEERCRFVRTRHYDNIPDTIFNQHPLFKEWKNKQRATIFTAVRGEGPPAITTSALLRWPVADRASVLPIRPELPLPHGEDSVVRGQWPRVPHEAVAKMIRAVANEPTTIEYLRNQASGGDSPCQLSLPPTGWYFVSALPPGTRNAAAQLLMSLPDEDTRKLAIAALNGHVAYGWWRAFGDGYHVKLSDFAGLTIPSAWLDGRDLDRALSLGEELIEAIPDSIKAKKNAGKEWPNVDFFESRPDLIAELDRFHIESLGLDATELLPHLRQMRSRRAWAFS